MRHMLAALLLAIALSSAFAEKCYNFIKPPTSDHTADKRAGHTAWISTHNGAQKMFVFGGSRKENSLPDTEIDVEIYDVTSEVWTERKISNPVRIVGQASVFDQKSTTAPQHGRLFVYGGLRAKVEEPDTSSWSDSLDILIPSPTTPDEYVWEHVPTTGAKPPALADASLVLERDHLVLFGGYNDQGFFNNVYVLPLSGDNALEWFVPKLSGDCTARRGHSATVVGDNLIIIGGTDGEKSFIDLSILKIPTDLKADTWSWTRGSASAPSGRAFHSAVRFDQEIIIFGGCAAELSECYNEVHSLNTESLIWSSSPVLDNNPKGRRRHSAVLTAESKILVFGGSSNSGKAFGTMHYINTVSVCKDSCLNGGVFEEGQCKCPDTWGGATCGLSTLPVCPNECSGHGKCVDQRCYCDSPYTGHDCSLDSSCNGHGQFNNDSCACANGWGMLDCTQQFVCPNGCSGNGRCTGFEIPADFVPAPNHYPLGLCHCDKDYYGEDCANRRCPADCSGNGVCGNDGRCVCYSGFFNEDCSKQVDCPKNCSSHGMCQADGSCLCDFSWKGTACDEFKCGDLCPLSPSETCNPKCVEGQGICSEGECRCYPGFSGPDCSIGKPCVDGCDNGQCIAGVCHCFPGYGSANCSVPESCPTGCKDGQGVCFQSKCHCFPGFSGHDCGQADQCASGCKQGRGVCLGGKCHCLPGYAGADCSGLEVCPKGCQAGRGICVGSKCHCLPGYGGEACHELEKCPAGCTVGQGVCVGGHCHCFPGFEGDNCAKTRECPNQCSDRGLCYQGQCLCETGFSGVDCSEGSPVEEPCKDDCNGHGVCKKGRCFCVDGFNGPACEVEESQCTNNCSGKGVCQYGRCWCSKGFSGADCSVEEKAL